MKIQLIKKINKAEEIARLINNTHIDGDFMFSDSRSTKESVIKLIQNKNFNLFVLVDDKPVGFCLVLDRSTKEIKHIAKIQAISILKEYRGRGLGRELLSFVINWEKNKNKELIYLEVISENKYAISLYKKLGFKKTGEIKGFAYFDKKRCGLSSYTKYL